MLRRTYHRPGRRLRSAAAWHRLEGIGPRNGGFGNLHEIRRQTIAVRIIILHAPVDARLVRGLHAQCATPATTAHLAVSHHEFAVLPNERGMPEHCCPVATLR